ncbi:MAG TPA: CGNR zinc finger domain-containing protein [Pseudonocardia sp.]|nr:CGNR zinc finger domain-containing protein [Pseudonocardia sp.]
MSAASGLEFGGASLRYGQPLAPGGLGLVHDLLATSPAGRPREPDLLESPDTATRWAGAAMSDWSTVSTVPSPAPTLSATDVDELRQLRDELRTALIDRDHGTEPSTGRAWTLTLGAEFDHTAADPAQTVRLGPRGTGWRLVASAVLLEVFLAQRDGTWQRLKVCRNHRCAGAFYDRSRNNSGVWHDVRTCGNVANLRASRARRRAQGLTEPG